MDHHVLRQSRLDAGRGRRPRPGDLGGRLPERRRLGPLGRRARADPVNGGGARVARMARGDLAVRQADVIVVGGGPAGAMAAMTVSARGVATLPLDKKRFPRDKPCGGGIRYGVLRRFPALADYLRTTVEIHEIRKVRMEGPSGASLLAESDEPFYLTLRRTEFDAALLARARAVGARVLEAVRVTDLLFSADGVTARAVDGRVFTARLVIGADGVNGVVARQAGLGGGFPVDALAIDTMEETELAELVPADPDTMYVAYGYKGYPGYGYVFPKRRHVDAGVGFLLSFFKERLDGPPYEHHARFLADARARGVVAGNSNPKNFKAYRLPLGGPDRKSTRLNSSHDQISYAVFCLKKKKMLLRMTYAANRIVYIPITYASRIQPRLMQRRSS